MTEASTSQSDSLPAAEPTHDVVIVGGGHNGLTAAAYLAQAGMSVIVLERLEAVGGAAVSAQAFDGVDAWLSRYSYLVSLLPQRIIDELGLRIGLARRRYSSYTPVPGDPDGAGLLVDTADDTATAESFARIGAPGDADAFTRFYEDTARVAHALWPTVTEPLLTRSEARSLVGDDELWDALIERPIGELITSRLENDLVRGVALTDALIGTFASADDPGLAQNRCFLYHVIGGGTGDWDVPIGGMGTVTTELARVAREAGARIVTRAEVTSIDPDGTVRYRRKKHERRVIGRFVLANVAPEVLDALLGEPQGPAAHPEGAQVKVNLLLKRLPKLRDPSVDPAAAFGGTFHINETYTQLESAYAGAVRGRDARADPVRDLLPLAHRSEHPGPETSPRRAPRPSRCSAFTPPTGWLSEENNDATARTAAAGGAHLAQLGARRADRGPPSHGCRRPAVHRDQDDARPAARAQHAGRQHLPRPALVAVRRGRRSAGDPGSALGCRDAARARAAVRLRRPSRWRGQRPRRSQRRDGRARELTCAVLARQNAKSCPSTITRIRKIATIPARTPSVRADSLAMPNPTMNGNAMHMIAMTHQNAW